MYRTIKVQQTGRVLLVRLSNPPHAFMNEAMVLDLEAPVDSADRDPGIGVVVLTGDQPDRFIAHFDVSEILQKARSYRAITEGRIKWVLSRFSPEAISAIKRVTLEGGSLPLAKGIQLEQAAVLHTIGLEACQRAMARYVAHVDREGVVPCYNAALREQLATGRFEDFNSPW